MSGWEMWERNPVNSGLDHTIRASDSTHCQGAVPGRAKYNTNRTTE